VFTDYMRPSMRLAAMMGLPVLYILTHDSIGVGEDGPTHQPVEHLAALRAIPNMVVVRPCDANETAEAYRVALQRGDGPTALVLTRQNLPVLDRSKLAPASGLAKGAYVLSEAAGGKPEVLLIGTGSEVAICLDAQERLQAEGIPTRVISMPSWELFEVQPADYRKEVLPAGCLARVAVEAGVRHGWERYLGPQGRFVGMSGFGASAPEKVLYKHFGITPEAVVARAKEALQALRQ
jgi:transketolase